MYHMSKMSYILQCLTKTGGSHVNPPFWKQNSKCANCVHMSLCPAGLQLHMSKSSIMTCL